jgi:transposase-like protein
MAGDPLIDQGQQLCEQVRHERQQLAPQRWRCSPELRSRLVAYSLACRADGESHQRVAERLGIIQTTLSRWIRKARASAPNLRQVAIVPVRCSRTSVAPAAPLRLVSPHGFVVEGLEPELVAYLLRVLG